jgi:class 3 adenylate cyclase
LKELDMRIGIHTGRVIAGIIGSKVVRYDIFGEGVLIANKMESNGIPGKVCVSLDSKKIIMKSPELSRQYTFTSHNIVNLPKIKKSVQSFIVEKRQDSFRS